MENKFVIHPESFDAYGDFTLEKDLALRHKCLPSKMGAYLDVEDSKANFDQAVAMIPLAEMGLQLLKQKWDIFKNKEGKKDEDYVYFQIYASSIQPIYLEIELSDGQLNVEFFYDHHLKEVEDWAFEQIARIRTVFASAKSPIFRVLRKSNQGNFETQKVNVDTFKIKLEENYNDDFLDINSNIRKAIEEKQSGLILLHGQPGTGKTSYIKSLISDFMEHKFIFVPNDFITDLLKPNFISFLIRQRNATLVIEDAEKVITSRERAEQQSVVSTILQLTDGLFSDYLNIKVICTFNTDVSRIDKALFRKGRMIAFYEFKALSLEKTRKLIKQNAVKIESEMTLAEIYHHNATDFSETVKKRPIGFF